MTIMWSLSSIFHIVEAVYTKVAKDFSNIMAPDLIPKTLIYIECMGIGRYSSPS